MNLVKPAEQMSLADYDKAIRRIEAKRVRALRMGDREAAFKYQQAINEYEVARAITADQ